MPVIRPERAKLKRRRRRLPRFVAVIGGIALFVFTKWELKRRRQRADGE
jgi:hypothetical protein